MRWRVSGGVAVLALALALPAVAPQAHGTFTSMSTNAGSVFAADVLDPPSGLSATRPCGPTVPTLVASLAMGQSTGTSITVPRPSEVQEGDLVLVVLAGPTTAGPWSTDGWTYYGGDMGQGVALFGKIASASEPVTYTFNGLVNGTASLAVVLVYRGVNVTNPWTGALIQSNGTASTTITGPDFTVLAPDTANLMVAVVLVPSYAGAVVPGSGWGPVTSVTPSDGLPGVLMVAEQTIAQNTAYAASATIATPKTSVVVEFVLRPAVAGTDGAVDLSWTASPDAAVTGYAWARSGSGSPASGAVPGLDTTWFTDATLPAGESAVYTLAATVAGWTSAAVDVAVPACP